MQGLPAWPGLFLTEGHLQQSVDGDTIRRQKPGSGRKLGCFSNLRIRSPRGPAVWMTFPRMEARDCMKQN